MSEKKGNAAFIVQARMGSTRLPGKVLMEMDKGLSLLEVLVEKIKRDGGVLPLIIAITDQEEDDILEHKLARMGINYFRGSSEDVLKRFVNCAEEYDIQTIIRICADNPFIDIKGTVQLYDEFQAGHSDYVSFCVTPKLPSIKSHIGLWGEVVSSRALMKTMDSTSEKTYREHVTNYVYAHRELFNVRLIPAPAPFYNRTDIRLTVDDITDYKLILTILEYSKRDILNFDITDILKTIEDHPQVLQEMSRQISKYQK
jgi:spore coat polysaccharide biosynthesis protein SpsF